MAGGSLEDSSPAFYNILSYKTLLSHPVWVAPCLENFPPKSTDIVVYIHLERDFKESKKDLLCSVPCDATQKCSLTYSILCETVCIESFAHRPRKQNKLTCPCKLFRSLLLLQIPHWRLNDAQKQWQSSFIEALKFSILSEGQDVTDLWRITYLKLFTPLETTYVGRSTIYTV